MKTKLPKLSRYEQRGVSAHKADVHRATANLDRGLFPGAFCKIHPDPDSRRHCRILHPDTAGTKAGLAYMAWKATGDLNYIRGIAINAFVMNTDDVACVGAIDNLMIDQTISRNAFLVPEEVVAAIIEGAREFCERLAKFGINLTYAAGETASVGDIVRTLDVGSSIFARMLQRDVIDASRIQVGDLIVGFSSTGQTKWESELNSGIGSNGLTNARHDTLGWNYRKDRELYAPQMPKRLVFRGPYQLTDQLPGDHRFTIADALLSPTRTYLPIIGKILELVGRKWIHALIHCSGGGQTKIGKFGPPGVTYNKFNPFPVPPVFTMIKAASGLSWREMFETFNMGHRLEAVVPDREIATDCMNLAAQCGIDARIVGRVSGPQAGLRHRVVITAPDDTTLEY